MSGARSAYAHDLLVIGAGTLGARIATGWRRDFPDARVVGETRSSTRHAALREAGVEPRQREEAPPVRFPCVAFCVPPSALGRGRDPAVYAAEAARAAALWDGRGGLVLTSSTAVYAESDGGACTEDGALATSERATRLLAAEAAVREAGGSVVRLAGLYDVDRGPHQVFLRSSTSPRRPDGWLNLVHYEDAATLCHLALVRGAPRVIYVGCDGAPVTRAKLVAAIVRAGLARPEQACVFEGRDGPLGRRCDNTWTRRRLGWQPRYPSFSAGLDAALTDSGPRGVEDGSA